MKSVPLPELPWEAQIMFWVLMILVGTGVCLTIWFLNRLVASQDEINKDVKLKFESIARKVEDIKSAVGLSAETLLKEVQAMHKITTSVRHDTLKDISQIKDDIRETKGVVKVVETHQTVLKTIIIKLNDIMIFKGRKE